MYLYEKYLSELSIQFNIAIWTLLQCSRLILNKTYSISIYISRLHI